MHLHAYRLRNYRRFKSAKIELGKEISIFVGSNNSGKTSATHAVHTFVSSAKDRLNLYDFSAWCWAEFDSVGEADLGAGGPAEISLPSIDIDLWLDVEAADLYLVLPLLPSTSWEGTKVGIRISFTAKAPAEVVRNYQTAKAKSAELTKDLPENSNYEPWPRSLTDYLQKELKNEYEFRYYVLDRSQFDADLNEIGGYTPMQLETEPGGAAVLKSLIQIDNLSAQRHLADPSTETGGAGRSEDLSKRLSRFYKRNLDQRQDDHGALRALSDSERALNIHLDEVFRPTLDRLSKLGYPGINNPELKIMSALDPAHVMSQDARVHYALGDGADAATLPDSYNGLGFKNLIYMVVEILDAQARWANFGENRPPLHLIFVEEPEAHLHAQLQQVFIRNVLDLLKIADDDDSIFSTQLVVTTHSPHILYERGFKPIRYFRKQKSGTEQVTEVLSLSRFYDLQPTDRDFLERYLKLTHCDLFFADAAILVEGNVERLLLPLMIEKVAKSLRSSCLTILEVGGAFGHRFKTLIEFLGLTTLIITDIDSVSPTVLVPDGGNAAVPEDEDDLEEFEVPPSPDDGAAEDPAPAEAAAEEKPKFKNKKGKACLPTVADAVTSNQTLISWLPALQTIAELRDAEDAVKTADLDDGAKVRVVYQTKRPVTWNGHTGDLYGRTLEEDFGLENPVWSQAAARKDIGLIVRVPAPDPAALAAGLHKKVSSKSFDKTKFALGVMTEDVSSWDVPAYIRDGLVWLKDQIAVEADEPLPGPVANGVVEVEAA
ncbi:AAA family ATPase [Rhizobium ruizarguesonis]|uniref:AAA family ATPase n=1 Tax=Rhizobium ruizarguesonis TaxID=2081791 RepID=UPI0010303BCB|nr:ATP-dependent endonuclease [Rhizobium ruizarguesonis]TAU59057.1 ATP-dependent endonuclease [Rhizobium ruizarguesonis]TAV03264.1 ATP-dependent endonuclease [Rhizobium ruizarguesonis]TAV18988.1 ATP-dependent endonuclease [Rhizobium ruizarguesonis]TAW70124.1 ATP-dependent endonuclease [Rhizobium ruizarguesonis]